MKYSSLLILLTFFFTVPTWGQVRYEREFRIKRTQFPDPALQWIDKEVKDARKIRFYKEIDSSITQYKVKFKKDRIHYGAGFNSAGELKGIALIIEVVDMPAEVYEAIQEYLSRECSRVKIHKMWQQYPVVNGKVTDRIIKDAFQNLILPYIHYEFVVSCKTNEGRVDFEYLFNAKGDFLSRRRSLPPNYDHILY